MRTALDRFGRIVIPKEVRDAAGLVAGCEMEVVSGPDGVVLRTVDDDAMLVNSDDGVLVFLGVAQDDLATAVRRHRAARVASLAGGLAG